MAHNREIVNDIVRRAHLDHPKRGLGLGTHRDETRKFVNRYLTRASAEFRTALEGPKRTGHRKAVAAAAYVFQVFAGFEPVDTFEGVKTISSLDELRFFYIPTSPSTKGMWHDKGLYRVHGWTSGAKGLVQKICYKDNFNIVGEDRVIVDRWGKPLTYDLVTDAHQRLGIKNSPKVSEGVNRCKVAGAGYGELVGVNLGPPKSIL